LRIVECGLRINADLGLRNSAIAIRNPQSAIAIRNPQSAIHN